MAWALFGLRCLQTERELGVVTLVTPITQTALVCGWRANLHARRRGSEQPDKLIAVYVRALCLQAVSHYYPILNLSACAACINIVRVVCHSSLLAGVIREKQLAKRLHLVCVRQKQERHAVAVALAVQRRHQTRVLAQVQVLQMRRQRAQLSRHAPREIVAVYQHVHACVQC